MEETEYLMPLGRASKELEVKKSRFIADAFFVDSRDAAKKHIAQVKTEFPDARHHCWAYLIGAPATPSMMAFSDDGEPSGTAGRPILNVMQHKNVGDILVVVTRYFGGVKLGASGLIRAYSSTAQQVYAELNLKKKRVLVEADIEADYAFEQSLRHWLGLCGGEVLNVSYEEERVIFNIRFPPALNASLLAFVSANKARVIVPDKSC